MAAFYTELKSLYLIIKITKTADALLAIQAKRFNVFLTAEQDSATRNLNILYRRNLIVFIQTVMSAEGDGPEKTWTLSLFWSLLRAV